MRLTALSIVAFLCAVASAEQVAIIVDTSRPGSIIVTIDSSGAIAVHPLSKVIVVDGPTPPPDPPPSPGLTDRGKAIRDLALKATADPNRLATARGLATLYREMAKLVRSSGAVNPTQLAAALSTGTDTFLASRGPPAVAQAWKPMRDLLGLQWTTLTAAGKELSAYASLLDEAADGLDASAPGSRAITPEMWDFILKVILPLILALLKG